MLVRDGCPNCDSHNYKRNGHIHNGKQNYQCKACGRQFVLTPEDRVITEEQRPLIKRLLLEKIPLRGICRTVGVSLKWLLGFLVECYDACPDHLNVQLVGNITNIIIQRLEAEVDELWSFVGKKTNKQWVWIALDVRTRQVIAFHVGDRSRKSAKKLWDNIPEVYRQRATFYTDLYDVYDGVIPQAQHQAISKQARKTNHVERFNGILRQRISRLVRETLSFSKKLENHIGAIKYFICHYNLTKATALHG